MPVTVPVLGKVSYEPIAYAYGESGHAVPEIDHVPEKASQTFKLGAPVVLNGGYLQECAFGGAELVYGVTAEEGQNLASDGVGTDGTSEGKARNQTNSKIIPYGSRMKDGKTKVYKADGINIFSIALKVGQVFAQSMVGTTYGLVKDGTTGFWYLDNTDTSGDNAVATVVGADTSYQNDATHGARVFFQFISTKRFFV